MLPADINDASVVHRTYVQLSFKCPCCVYLLLPSLMKTPKWVKSYFDLVRGARVSMAWQAPFAWRTMLILSQVCGMAAGVQVQGAGVWSWARMSGRTMHAHVAGVAGGRSTLCFLVPTAYLANLGFRAQGSGLRDGRGRHRHSTEPLSSSPPPLPPFPTELCPPHPHSHGSGCRILSSSTWWCGRASGCSRPTSRYA